MERRLLVCSAVVVGVAMLAGCGGSGPNYGLAPTASCLRADWYTVSHPYVVRWTTGKGEPTIEVRHPTRPHPVDEFVTFSSSVANARRDSDATDYGLVTRRNVVFNIEADVGLSSRDKPIVACLRSSAAGSPSFASSGVIPEHWPSRAAYPSEGGGGGAVARAGS